MVKKSIRFCLVLTLAKCFFFCINIFSVAMTKTLNQDLKQWQPAPIVSSLSLESVRIVSRYKVHKRPKSLMGTPLFTGDNFQWTRFCNATVSHKGSLD